MVAFVYTVVIIQCMIIVCYSQTWNCNNEASCLSEIFTCQSGDTCNLVCRESYSCHFGVLICEEDSVCSIHCSSTSLDDYSCSDMIIDATDAHSLNITIDNDNFQRSIAYCPHSKENSDNVVCVVEYNDPVSFNNSKFYTLNGYGSDLIFLGNVSKWNNISFEINIDVYYGDNYIENCLITSNTTYPSSNLYCNQITTPAPTSPPVLTASVEWTCNGTASCLSQSFTCNSFDICFLKCYGQYACHFSTLVCSSNSICYLECGTNGLDNSCSDMIIDARYAQSFVFFENGINSLYDFARSTIYCPINNYDESCTVYFVSIFAEFDFSNSSFYVVTGLNNDIQFIGNINHKDEQLFTDETSVISSESGETYIYYGSYYENICELDLMQINNSYYEFDCFSINLITPSPIPIIPTVTTTPQPTFDINYFTKYPYFCRGYHFLRDDISGSEVINCSSVINIDTFNDEISSCQYNSISFSAAYSSYSSYSSQDDYSISGKFSAKVASGGGSLSQSRKNTKVTVKNSQSYIYRLDFSCVEADMSLPSYFKVVWDDDFLFDINGLPQIFDVNDYTSASYEAFVNFWGKYGTHIIQSAKLGGSIYGTVITDYCSVNTDFSSSDAYQLCLNAEYKGAGMEGCGGNSDTTTESQSASYYVSKTTVTVRGGDSSTFGAIINDFGNTEKQTEYDLWINSLQDNAYIVGGNLQPIYSVIQEIVHSGNEHNMDKYIEHDSTLLNIANSMQNAYAIYVNKSMNSNKNIGCSFGCGSGEMNTQSCQCEGCTATECCDIDSVSLFYPNIFMSTIYLFTIILFI